MSGLANVIVGSYKNIPFGVITASGTFTPAKAGSYEIHCVGGGGGGGGWYGGGGAGGYYSTATLTLAVQAYTVTVGALGAANNVNATGIAGTGGTTSFVGPSTVTAAGGIGGEVRNFGTTTIAANGGSGGAGAADAGTGNGGGGGGYDGSNSSKSTSVSYGAQVEGTGQLAVAIGLGTNTYIPSGGAGSFQGNSFAGTRSGLGGVYQGIYGYGAGHAGNFGGLVAEGQSGSTATGYGTGGGGANWVANGAGPGAQGMIVWRGPL